MHDYEPKFANLPDHLQLIKLLQYRHHEDRGDTTLDDAELDKLGSSCRDHTLLK